MKVGDLVYWVYGARSRPEKVLGVVIGTNVIPSAGTGGATQHRIVVDNTRLVVSASSLEVINGSR